MEAVTTALSNSGETGEGVRKLKCVECGKVCRGKTGLTLRSQKMHPLMFHATNVPTERVTPRWNEGETYLLAKVEAELVISGTVPKKINSLLYGKCPSRTQEAIKGQQRGSAYNELVTKLVEEMSEQDKERVETPEQTMSTQMESGVADILQLLHSIGDCVEERTLPSIRERET